MIRFQSLWLLFLFLLASVPLVPVLRRLRRRSRIPVCLGPDGGEAFSAASKRSVLSRLPAVFEITAVSLLLFVAAGPQTMERLRVQLDRGGDVLFVLDVSPSMSARDMEGSSRFERARELIRGFSADHPASSLGIVAVASRAVPVCPPTVDHPRFLDALDRLRIGAFGEGTALGSGIAAAVLHLSSSSAPGRRIVLLTDGENNAGEIHPHTAARMARERGIDLEIVATGKKGQTVIDYVDPLSGVPRHGSFLSRYDDAAFAALAREAGGSWMAADDTAALAEAFARISRQTIVGGRTRDEYRATAFFRAPLVTALALFALAALLRRYVSGALP